MLAILRKIFGLLALLWVGNILLGLFSAFISSKLAGQFLALGLLTTPVGLPASVSWAVLKIIDVLNRPKVVYVTERAPAPQAAAPQPASAVPHNGRHTAPVQGSRPVYTYEAPGMPLCPECGCSPTIFYCSTHNRALCLGCVARHDDPRECVYVPAFRAPKSNAGQATTSGPAKTPSKGKPGDVLGIS